MIIENRTILQGHVMDRIKEIPNASIDTIITSPPYWGLRDYSVEGQWGLEPDFHDYLKHMQELMVELKRLLKPTGTCWINLGDTYSSIHTGGHKSDKSTVGANRPEAQEFRQTKEKILQEKSRCGVPERFYIQCIDSGWIARNPIVWYKANSMPSSVRDRFTNKYEMIYFFAKQRKYYFNLDAVREKTIGETIPFNVRVRDNISGKAQKKLGDAAWTATEEEKQTHNKLGEKIIHEKYIDEPNSNVARLHKERVGNPNKQDNTLGANGKPILTYKGFNERWKEAKEEVYGDDDKGKRPSRVRASVLEKGSVYCERGKNPGDVFFINPRPFPEAHFATFPVDLPLKILKCACPKDGIVLDPFFGAGTVGLAAEKLGLDWCGIELNPEYIEIARKRLASYKNNRLFD